MAQFGTNLESRNGSFAEGVVLQHQGSNKLGFSYVNSLILDQKIRFQLINLLRTVQRELLRIWREVVLNHPSSDYTEPAR